MTHALALLAACAPKAGPGAPGPNEARLRYPAALATAAADTLHETVLPDPYRWLEDTASAATHAWVAAEQRLTSNYLAAIPERGRIRARLAALRAAPRKVGLTKRGGRYFYYGQTGGVEGVYWRSSAADSARLLLDPATLATDPGSRLGIIRPSHDGRRIAFGLSHRGADRQEFRVREVDTGRDLADRILRGNAPTWTHDGAGFFYGRASIDQGEVGRLLPNEIYYHRLGTPQSTDTRVTEAKDRPESVLDPRMSDDGRFLIIRVLRGNDRNNGISYLDLGDAGQPNIGGPVVPLFDRFDASYGFVGNQGPIFYFWTNSGAPRGRVIAVDTRQPGPERWTTVIPETTDVLDWVKVVMVNNQLVAGYMVDAQQRLRRFALDGAALGEIPLPVPGSVGFGYLARTQDDPELFYTVSSFLYPNTTFRYDFRSGRSEEWFERDWDFDAARYTTHQVFYSSKDGTRVPMFLTHRRDLTLAGANPTLLFGYGAFGVPMTPGFSIDHLVWLELGGVYAVANIRGGGEYGESWHQAAIREKRQVTLDDFIAAGEYLIREKYTRPSKLAINGASWGSTLVQAVMNQRPELFGAVLPERAGGSMLRYDDPVGAAEFGSLRDPAHFRAIRAYSPLENIRAGVCYPATMVLNGAHDDRGKSGPSPAYKYVATLQRAQGCDRPVLLRIDPDAGHGPGGIDEAADRLAFLVRALRIEMKP